MQRFRRVAALGLSGALLIAGTASAGTFFDNTYQGHAESDNATYVGFDLNDARTRVTHLKTYLYFHCPGNPTPQGASGESQAKIKLAKGRFKDTVDGDLLMGARGGSPNVIYKITGRLLKHGKAKGTIEASVRTSATRGGPTIRCYTGKLDWKAKRGAHAAPISREGRR